MLEDYLRKIVDTKADSISSLNEQYNKRDRELTENETRAKKQRQETLESLSSTEEIV